MARLATDAPSKFGIYPCITLGYGLMLRDLHAVQFAPPDDTSVPAIIRSSPHGMEQLNLVLKSIERIM